MLTFALLTGPVPHPRLRVLLRHLGLLFLARPGRSSSPCRSRRPRSCSRSSPSSCVNEYVTASPLVVPVLVAYGLLAGRAALLDRGRRSSTCSCPVIPLADRVPAGRRPDAPRQRRPQEGRPHPRRQPGPDGRRDRPAVLARPLHGRGRRLRRPIVRLFASPDGLVQPIGACFPPSIWATRALAFGCGPGPAGVALYLALVAGVSFAAFIALRPAELFYRGLIGLERDEAPRRKTPRRRHVSPRLLRPEAGPGPLPAGIADHEPDADLPPQRRALGVLIPIVFIVMGKTGGETGSIRPELIGLLGSANPADGRPRRGPVHDHLRLPQRDGLLDLLPRGRPVLDVQESSPSPPATRSRGSSSTPWPSPSSGWPPPTAAGAFVFAHQARSIWPAPWPWPCRRRSLLTVVGMMIDLARPLLDLDQSPEGHQAEPERPVRFLRRRGHPDPGRAGSRRPCSRGDAGRPSSSSWSPSSPSSPRPEPLFFSASPGSASPRSRFSGTTTRST